MRHGAQQIGAHTLAFGFDLFRFALPELHGQCACQHSNNDQQRSGDQILRQREVKRKVRKGKSVIDRKHGKKRGCDAVNVAVGQQRDQKYGKYKQNIVRFTDVEDIIQKETQRKGADQQYCADGQIFQNTFTRGCFGFHGCSVNHTACTGR